MGYRSFFRQAKEITRGVSHYSLAIYIFFLIFLRQKKNYGEIKTFHHAKNIIFLLKNSSKKETKILQDNHNSITQSFNKISSFRNLGIKQNKPTTTTTTT
jgi:hypothetical protein